MTLMVQTSTNDHDRGDRMKWFLPLLLLTVACGPKKADSRVLSKTTSCHPPSTLEPVAAAGKLTMADRSCLESAMARTDDALQTLRIAHVLMLHADASGESKAWDRLAERTFAKSQDANLAYEYAVFLARGGPDHAADAMKWSDLALRHAAWEGDMLVRRRHVLLRIQREAAQVLWVRAEADYAADPSPERAEAAQMALERSMVTATVR
jgi:hypothetical protein